MEFQCVNEVRMFDYRDCKILSWEMTEEGLKLVVEALIVGPFNSQNPMMCRSYADTTTILFKDVVILNAYAEGLRRYDANDNLIEEVPDVDLTQEQIDEFKKWAEGNYLADIRKDPDENKYQLLIECTGEEPYGAIGLISYCFNVSSDEVVCSWDRFLNRVE